MHSLVIHKRYEGCELCRKKNNKTLLSKYRIFLQCYLPSDPYGPPKKTF